MKIFRKLLDLIAVSLAFALLATSGLAQSHSGVFAKPQIVGAEDPSKRITVTVWLKQRNKAAFDELVHQIYQPGSPQYHHFLTHEQYRAQFAPSPAAAAQVQEYLKANKLTVTSVDKYNHYVVVQGRVRDVQNAFSVHLNRINLKGNIHRVSDAEAAISGPVGELIQGVTGLDDFVPRPAGQAFTGWRS